MVTLNLNYLAKKLPSYAEDIARNIVEFFNNDLVDITVKQACGIALTAGYFLRNEQMLNIIRSIAKEYLEESDADAAKTIVVNGTLISTYHNFNIIAQPNGKKINFSLRECKDLNISQMDYELYNLTVAILLKCSHCITYHTKQLAALDFHNQNDVAYIASLLTAAKSAFEIENIRSYEFLTRGSVF